MIDKEFAARTIKLIEGNVLIAKLMGWTIDNSYPDKNKVWRSPGGRIELDTTFKFHKSWDELMPVLKHIVVGEDFIQCVKSNYVFGAWEEVVDILKRP